MAVFFLLISSASVYPQSGNQQPQGGFPDAEFYGRFNKFIPSDNRYHPYYAWDASVGLEATLFRLGYRELDFFVIIDSAGTEKKTSRINVAGAGYRFGLKFKYFEYKGLKFLVGFDHLSLHITDDLLKKIAEEVMHGKKIPPINTSDLNVVFFEFGKEFSGLPLKPEIRFRYQPMDFRFRGSRHHRFDQPVYLDLQATLWQGNEKRIMFESQHEFGKDSYNTYQVRLELFARHQKEGRFQIFFGGSPGNNLHSSPNQGWLRDGWSGGIIMKFRAK